MLSTAPGMLAAPRCPDIPPDMASPATLLKWPESPFGIEAFVKTFRLPNRNLLTCQLLRGHSTCHRCSRRGGVLEHVVGDEWCVACHGACLFDSRDGRVRIVTDASSRIAESRQVLRRVSPYLHRHAGDVHLRPERLRRMHLYAWIRARPAPSPGDPCVRLPARQLGKMTRSVHQRTRPTLPIVPSRAQIVGVPQGTSRW
jgi:hypothetical protein